MEKGVAMYEGKRVAIVGGGLAGLSAAYTLKKGGLIADVYEASGIVGGRCRNDYTDGYQFFAGAGSTEPQWKTTFQYLQELGLMDHVIKQAGESGIGLFINGKPEIAHLGGGLFSTIKSGYHFAFKVLPKPVRKQGKKFFKVLGAYKKQLDFEKGDFTALEEISNISVAEWARQNQMEDLDEYILSPLLSMMCLATSEEIAMGHIIMLFSLMQGMCSMDGGMGIISEALYDQVKEQVHFNTPVQEVVIEDGKCLGVKINGELVETDFVIVGLDAVRTLNVVPNLPEEMARALRTCGYSKTFYYQFGLEEPIERIKRSFVMIPKSTDTIIECVSDGGSEEYPILLTETRGQYQEELAAMSPEDRAARVIKAVQEVFPEMPDNPKITKCYRWDYGVNLEGPGQFQAVNDLKKNHMHDVEGLHLAGDYLFLIASTEGSMNSAQIAGEYVLEQLK